MLQHNLTCLGHCRQNRKASYQIQDDIRDETALKQPEKAAADEEAGSPAEPKLRRSNDAPKAHDGGNLDHVSLTDQ